MRYLLLLALLSLVNCPAPDKAPAAGGTGARAQPAALTMAFVPSVEAQQVLDSGEQLSALLGERIGLRVEPLQATSYVGIVEAMSTGDVQVAWLPPMAYVFAHQRNGAEVILKVVRHGSPTYRGQILVAADSEINTLEDLKGKKVAFPEQTSASGHLYPKALLLAHGIDPERDCTVIFSGSHDAALTGLLKGSVDAACTFDDAREGLRTAFPDIMQTTRVLTKTEDIPADCVAVSSDLDAETAAQVRDALLALSADEAGQQVLMDLYEIEGLVEAADSDYDPVREMARELELDVAEQVD